MSRHFGDRRTEHRFLEELSESNLVRGRNRAENRDRFPGNFSRSRARQHPQTCEVVPQVKVSQTDDVSPLNENRFVFIII